MINFIKLLSFIPAFGFALFTDVARACVCPIDRGDPVRAVKYWRDELDIFWRKL